MPTQQLQLQQQFAHTQQSQQSHQQPSQQFQSSTPHNFSLNLKPLLEESKDQHHAPAVNNNPQALANDRFPSLPRRYRDGTFKRTTSEYCYTYRDPASYSVELGAPSPLGSSSARQAGGPIPGSRIAHRARSWHLPPP
jgi:hypothetical protein